MRIAALTPSDHPALVMLWERAVRATHHFLAEDDIVALRALVADSALPALDLVGIRDEAGAVLGFAGLDGRRLEALFVDPAHHGRGVGSALLRYAVDERDARLVDVNEQNARAVGFYLRSGAEVLGRSERDGQGRPFPLLHLRLPGRVRGRVITEAGGAGVSIRRLGADDVALARATFTVMQRAFDQEPAELPEAYLAALLARDAFWALAAMHGEEPLGGLTAHEMPMTRSPSRELFIYDLAVRADRQRRGIGRALVEALRAAGAAEGIATCIVPADDDDAHALDFYRALGGMASPVTLFVFEAEPGEGA
ncbi:MAG: GNAT family N-acetyltransferase [Gemmatimonadales bacterium]|nr:GNAT family N-acetyltransferase [Gemmatimonadales bacterium]